MEMVQRAKPRSVRDRTRSANDAFLSFTTSVHFDHRLWKFDIAGSIAHANTLADGGILTKAELERMVTGLRNVAGSIESGEVELDPKLEDVHMNIERLLTDAIGDVGAKLHTGRSRNDQIALDMRLIVREMVERTISEAIALQSVLLQKAKDYRSAAMPGYTHMQHAQPILLAHHLLAHFWRVDRDISRLTSCYSRTNVSPLGSGALAGSSYNLDRRKAAKALGMALITENSLDAVSDRDFVAEFTFTLSLVMIHLSSLSEELVNWSSKEFGFVRIPRSVGGGSSMMPQKLNPDIAELVRGKSGRTIGDLVAVLTLLKSLPLAYNRDLQEDKESLFDAFDTAEASLRALTTLIAEIDFDKVRMRNTAEAGLMTATDLADFLTKKGVPFRKAHAIVKQQGVDADGDDARFLALARNIMSKYSEAKVRSNYLSVDSIIARRDGIGGTSPRSVSKQMSNAAASLTRNESTVASMRHQTEKIGDLLRG